MELLHILFSPKTIDDVAKLVQIAAIFIGGLLAYIKFFRGRIYHSRLEPKVTGTVFCKNGISYLTAKSTLKNLGPSRVDIKQNGSGLRVSASREMPGITEASETEWTEQRVFEVFTSEKMIESGETLEEEQFIVVPGCDHIAFKLELRIVSDSWLRPQGFSWQAVGIVCCALEAEPQKSEAA